MLLGDYMEIFVLASGSKGNMTLVKTPELNFFIDAGITYSRAVGKMKNYNEEIENVNVLFLTHEHLDHIAGLKTLLKQKNIKEIYLTKGTFQALSVDIKELMPKVIIIKADEPLKIKGVDFLPIMLSHDAAEPVGFVIKSEGKKFVVLTDTGYVDHTYIDVLKCADVYLVEANHDPKKLLDSSRPFSLKQRILGITGHLSNDDAAILMNKLINDKKALWIASHISDDCNGIFEIEKAIVDHFDNPLKVDLKFASQESLEVIKI